MSQLRALCRMLGIQPIGTPEILRFQLMLKLRELKADDRVSVSLILSLFFFALVDYGRRWRGSVIGEGSSIGMSCTWNASIWCEFGAT
jgi:hypothetical protein